MKPYFDSIEFKHIAVAKYQNGIMLYNIINKRTDFLLSLADLFALPYSVYLLDTMGATLKINEVGASICGFSSPDQAIGKTIFDVSIGHSAKNLLDNCASVLQQESVKIFDEYNMRFDGKSLQFLSIKFPCYDAEYQLQGTFGISIVLGEHSLADAITQLSALGLLSQNTSQNQTIKLNLGNVLLTSRETECLEYTVKGFTAKQIAKKLHISYRTVEDYINQVKIKLDVSTKQEMIQKLLNS